jgi:hypothetical protein
MSSANAWKISKSKNSGFFKNQLLKGYLLIKVLDKLLKTQEIFVGNTEDMEPKVSLVFVGSPAIFPQDLNAW